jgi:hypothetical protein
MNLPLPTTATEIAVHQQDLAILMPLEARNFDSSVQPKVVCVIPVETLISRPPSLFGFRYIHALPDFFLFLQERSYGRTRNSN